VLLALIKNLPFTGLFPGFLVLSDFSFRFESYFCPLPEQFLLSWLLRLDCFYFVPENCFSTNLNYRSNYFRCFLPKQSFSLSTSGTRKHPDFKAGLLWFRNLMLFPLLTRSLSMLPFPVTFPLDPD
jgi:hypothetical protein